ncbi:MAG: methylmalonyl Co-A mutase-associated GTPase MeaB [Bacteroidetes bacterium]|nr:methylmalonyl Co-A mutase-associated GTPase MeaB [Bacteroidota bacterium]
MQPGSTRDWGFFLQQIQQGSVKHLSRSISLVENGVAGYENLLSQIKYNDHAKIIGITGPPGAGKSVLTDALIGEMVNANKKTAVLCVDPSSPFNYGALLGDRIRLSQWYNHPLVFIRSLASRGSLGGLNPKIIEITELIKAGDFDYIFVETVGVGQSEVEIAGLADITVVVSVPEGGDEVQTMKAGLMEIADIFVVNKSDRPDADEFVKNLRMMLAPAFATHVQEIPIIKTVASEKKGTTELFEKILEILDKQQDHLSLKAWLMAERAYQLLIQKRMQGISKHQLQEMISTQLRDHHFNLYQFVNHDLPDLK